jgi:hypothetical protein
MNPLYIALAMLIAAPALGCQITLVNDTNQNIFAFDDAVNEGYVIQTDGEANFGVAGRHPKVMIYIQIFPGESYKQSYILEQIACALSLEDKIITLSSIIADTYNKDVFTVSSVTTDMDTLTCCGHHGSPQ